VAYESKYESFEVIGQDGQASRVVFKKAGTLAAGDRPELYFFEVNQRPVVVCVSGDALTEWQRAHRYMSREEKIDVAGLFLKQRIEQGRELVAENLGIAQAELASLARALGIRE
jgi:hypothetical protein